MLKSPATARFVRNWILSHTTASSNSKKVVKVKEKGVTYNHVVHWKTDTYRHMYTRCRLAAKAHFKHQFEDFKFTYFYRQVPSFVRQKDPQDGLCPYYHTAIELELEFNRKRKIWHKRCFCTCDFCSPIGCDHGKSPLEGICARQTCICCSGSKCPLEWNNTQTIWNVPAQIKRKGGGLYWINEPHTGSQKTMLKDMISEMKFFVEHDEHVEYHKDQIAHLLEHFGNYEVVIKADFIQNIVHNRGREISSAHYGKRQSQFLSFVIWYRTQAADGTWTVKKRFVDYISSYLNHNSLFFQKCTYHLLTYMRQKWGLRFQKVTTALLFIFNYF